MFFFTNFYSVYSIFRIMIPLDMQRMKTLTSFLIRMMILTQAQSMQVVVLVELSLWRRPGSSSRQFSASHRAVTLRKWCLVKEMSLAFGRKRKRMRSSTSKFYTWTFWLHQVSILLYFHLKFILVTSLDIFF